MIRVGVIGSGFGAIGLLPAFRSVSGCEVVSLDHPRSGWHEFLERGDLDAVAIAVPPAAQYQIEKYAIERGMHVFAEKPLAADLEQARELCVLAKENGIVHGIDFMFPEIAEWRKAKEMLAAEELGPCRHVAVDWTWLSGDLRHDRSTWRTDVAAGGGVLSLHFSHGLHYLEHFAGKITDVACLFSHSPRSRNGGEVGVDMLLTFPDSVTGSVHVSCNSPGRVAHRLVFQCERGVIVLENSDAVVDNFSVRTYSESGEQLVAVEADTGQPGEDERAKIVRRVAERFVEACAGKGHASPSFEDGLRAHELIELARRNAVPR